MQFGTDGIRGRAGVDITEDLAFRFGNAAVRVLGDRIHIGRDTRPSGPALADAVCRGVADAGGVAIDSGVLGSGALAFNCVQAGADGAVMVSASHNPVDDNGLKLFGPDGSKVSAGVQDQMESAIAEPLGRPGGTVTADPDAVDRYRQWLLSFGFDLQGRRLLIDHADGAAAGVAQDVLTAAGAEVTVLPGSGIINDGSGAAHPERLAANTQSRLGLAFDGDADRLVCADESGRVVNGDVIMALIAGARKKSRGLTGLVVTVMSNQSLVEWCHRNSIGVARSGVGDREVLEMMRELGFELGGEQSGHFISTDHLPTGDGLLTALLLLDALQGAELADLIPFEPWPQILENVAVTDPSSALASQRFRDELRECEAELGGSGRVLVRASGTEPVIRVMVEAVENHDAERHVRRLVSSLEGVH